MAHPKWRRSRKCQNVRQEISRRVHDVDLPLAIRDTHVHVHAENQERPRDGLQFLHEQLITVIIEYLLVLPARNRMRRSRHDLQPVLLCQSGDDAAQARNVYARFLNVLADARANFDLRLNHFRLDLLAQDHLAFFEKLRDVRPQFATLRIDNLELFFDTQGEFIEHNDYSATEAL